MDLVLLYFALKSNGCWPSIYSALAKCTPVTKEEMEEAKKEVTELYITYNTGAYPKVFQSQCMPPFVVFYRGNIELINSRMCLGFIGDGECSEYALQKALDFVRYAVKRDVTIVVASTPGLEQAVIRETIKRGGKIIVTIPRSLEEFYPCCDLQLRQEIIDAGGLILSERPKKVRQTVEDSVFFFMRDRLIALISDMVFVPELLTGHTTELMTFLIDNGNDVCCLAGRDSRFLGTHPWIRLGARLIDEPDELFQEFKGRLWRFHPNYSPLHGYKNEYE